ncbi:MAG: ATP-binding protein [Ilumatobacteraceae bacterium]
MTTNITNGGASDQPDVIVLTVPATPRHAATARVVAASLAADLGFDVDEIDDLRLGLNEAVAVLADHEIDDADDRLRIEFRTVPAGRGSARIDVVVRRDHGTSATSSDLDELAERILAAVVDQHEHRDGAIQLSKSSRGPG